eukprot:TRINITY_DN3934_c0_g1_i2.p1 TRINITY_DN3934_c0_g1~~TRINITY_DN3934_c0_g1_i2.p1  ORF type:complete len:189 (-),score=62.63 TRINITY_DN3934_c0_g1_i2:277-843(-)
MGNLRNSHPFKNPYILEKVISYLDIQETGSNYPTDLFNPNAAFSSDYYDTMQAEYDRRKALPRTSIEFTKSGPTIQPMLNSSLSNNPKSRWDKAAAPSSKPNLPPVAKPANEPSVIRKSGTTTIISAPAMSAAQKGSGNPKNNPKKANQPPKKQSEAPVASSNPYLDYIKEKKRQAELQREEDSKRQK